MANGGSFHQWISATLVSLIGACSLGDNTGKGCSPAADRRGARIAPVIEADVEAGASAVIETAAGL